MRHADDLGLDEYRAAIAVTRLVLGPKARVQAPPNLVDLDECRALLGAGVDDWGGVSPLTPDHVNPERPWPSPGAAARRSPPSAASSCRARLTVHPEYVRAGEPWLDPRVSAHVAALADDDGLARPGVRPDRAAVAGARRRLRLRRPHRPVRGRRHRGPHRRPPLRLRRRLRRLGRGARQRRRALPGGSTRLRPAALGLPGSRRCAAAEKDPGNLSDEHALTLMTAEGDAARAGLPAGRRPAPRDRRRRRHLRRQPQHQLHQRLLRRLPVLRVRPAAHRRRRLLALPRRGRRPRRGGLGPRRHRGLHAGRHRPRAARHGVLRPRHRGEAAGARRCTCTRSARWRSSTAPPAPGCRSRTS